MGKDPKLWGWSHCLANGCYSQYEIFPGVHSSSPGTLWRECLLPGEKPMHGVLLFEEVSTNKEAGRLEAERHEGKEEVYMLKSP